ncbi:Uncharacterised protein [Neisseria meningitidis]|nr:Uncharacterised protein [Neisseria meningitidis]
MSILSKAGLFSALSTTALICGHGAASFLAASNTVMPFTLSCGAEQSTKKPAKSRPLKLNSRLPLLLPWRWLPMMPVITICPSITTSQLSPLKSGMAASGPNLPMTKSKLSAGIKKSLSMS